MTRATAADLLVLHTLRCIGSAGYARVAVATGLAQPDVESELLLNPRLLEICSAWQLRSVGGDSTLNDHTDPAYDGRVLDRLTELHRRADAVCADLATTLLRFDRYRDRLDHALARADAGALDYVTDDFASYHTVWFQLHEDLLVTLSFARAQ